MTVTGVFKIQLTLTPLGHLRPVTCVPKNVAGPHHHTYSCFRNLVWLPFTQQLSIMQSVFLFETCSRFYFETFSANFWVTNENRAWLCDALFLTSNLHFQKLTIINTKGICWKYISFKISSRSVKFLCENVCFGSVVKGFACFKWYEFICEPDELTLHLFPALRLKSDNYR